jgi:hypothetical protein
MRPDQQFSQGDCNGIRKEQDNTEQLGDTGVITTDKEERDEERGQQIEEAPEGNEAMISCPLKNLVNDDLKQPVVIVPGPGRGYEGKESIAGDGSVLPKTSSA